MGKGASVKRFMPNPCEVIREPICFGPLDFRHFLVCMVPHMVEGCVGHFDDRCNLWLGERAICRARAGQRTMCSDKETLDT